LKLLYTSNEVSTLEHVRELVEPAATVYDDLDFSCPSAAARRPFVALNMLSTIDGKVTLNESYAQQFGTRVDRDVMFHLRLHFDAVLRGAATVRENPWYPRVPEDLVDRREERGLTRQPLAVVITTSCRLPLNSEYFGFAQAPAPTIVLTTEQAPPRNVAAARERAAVYTAGRDRVDIASALDILSSEFGVQRLLSEGGPRLNWDLLKAHCLDELFWTVAPRISGAQRDLSVVRGPAPLDPLAEFKLLTLYYHEGELFARYRAR